MRRCKIAPNVCTQPGKPCCSDCADKACQSRCLNNPKRCGCWEDSSELLPRKRGLKPTLDRDEIVRLYKTGGLLQYQIALQLGYSTSGVSKVLREMGVTGRGKS